MYQLWDNFVGNFYNQHKMFTVPFTRTYVWIARVAETLQLWRGLASVPSVTHSSFGRAALQLGLAQDLGDISTDFCALLCHPTSWRSDE